MNRFILVVLLAFAPGCNSEEFTTFNRAELDAADSAPSTGGAVATGGASSSAGGASTGGRLSTGGSMAAGGSTETGGAASTGGAVIETGGAPNTGGAPLVDACALVTHDNGIGQTWQDCVPLGTYNQEQAMKACEAFTGDSKACAVAIGCGASFGDVIRSTLYPEVDYFWTYSGNHAGNVGMSCAVDRTWN